MKTRFFSLLSILATISLLSFANDEIILNQGSTPDPGEPTNPRSIESEIAASIDGQVVTVSFSELTASQIVVTDSADQTVFNQTYTPAYSVQANLSILPSGSYTLHIYALGSWWFGQFVL